MSRAAGAERPLGVRPRGPLAWDERVALPQLRELANQAFSRAAGAPLIAGNSVCLLEDGRENYARWLAAIRAATDHVHFETYFIQEDDIGREFAEAFRDRARAGVRVRVLYDWLGGFRKASRGYWQGLRDAGVEVRAFNPPRISNPLGWLSRNHRKQLVADDSVAFISGLCVGKEWLGDPALELAPWRDTGIEIRGPALAEIEAAFARTWSFAGDPLPETKHTVFPPTAGDVNLRIVSSEPATAGMMRLDQLVAALAKSRLWLTDAYYAGTASYVQALRAAAQDGVDVRLLVPHATDIPLLRPLSRAGYRPLLEAGVRVFEWNGSMVHAKTAVADGRWARIGSTNLNLASWLGNCELDAVVEDQTFATQMEAMYERDLAHSTEVVLEHGTKLRAPGAPQRPRGPAGRRRAGSTRRVTAGAMRIGNTLGAAFIGRRVLGPVEAQLATVTGLVLCTLAAIVALFPRVLAYPVVALGLWGGIALLWKGAALRRARKRAESRE